MESSLKTVKITYDSNDCLHDNDTNMPDGVATALGLPYDEKNRGESAEAPRLF